MKHILLPVVFVALLLQAYADDSPYRAALKSAHNRYRILNEQRNDHRKPKPELPADREEEYVRLLGQLLTDDPVWALTEELQADIDALIAVRSRTPADKALLEDLKNFLAIMSGLQERATTREEAEQIATTLRQFIDRRDAAGALAWAYRKKD